MYTIVKVFNVQSFTCTHNTFTYIHGAFPLAPLTPCWFPFVSLSTYLAPSSCDRNRPPPSQVACKLTPFAPPFTQLTHPLQIPRTPIAPSLTMTTSGIFRLLLSGTVRALEKVQGNWLLFLLGLSIFVLGINWVNFCL
jgi:hypothetical protein